MFVPCQEGPEKGWFLEGTKASCQCVERVICSGSLIVIWKYPAIVDNWLRNILAALNHFSVFTDDCAIRYGECTKLCCSFSIYRANKCELNFQLMLLSSVAFCATGVGQLSSPARPLVSPTRALPLPCSFSLGVMFGCAGMAVLIRLMSVLCVVVVILH